MTAELNYRAEELSDLYYSADYLRCQGNHLREDNYVDAREKSRCYETAAKVYQRMGDYLDSQERAKECRILTHEWKEKSDHLYRRYLIETKAFGPFDVVALILGFGAAVLPFFLSHVLMAVGV